MSSLQAFSSGRRVGGPAASAKRTAARVSQNVAPKARAAPAAPRRARALSVPVVAAAAPVIERARRPPFEVKPAASPELLRERSAAGQAAREAALNGAVVLFVCAGYGKKRFIYEKARSLGVKAVLVDSANHWGRDCVGSAFDAFHAIDLSKDTDTVLDQITDIYNKIVEEYGAVHGICSFSDLAQPLVARLCERLGYPANTVEAVAVARNKDLTRLALKEAGLPTPDHMLITRPEQLPEAAARVGFPAVLKPVGGSESIGVVRVDNTEQLMDCYHQLQSILSKTAYKDGSFSTYEEESDTEGNANAALEFFSDLMMEQYMDGCEVDVDIVLSDGEVVYANVVDNGPTHEPWFQETNTNCPSLLSEDRQRELIETATASLKALGLTHGVQHTELKYTSRGARLLEVNPRMGGRGVHTINRLSTGVCMVTEQLLASCGLPCNPPRPEGPLGCIGEYGVISPKSGVLQDHAFIEKWASHPDVVYCRPLANVGAKLIGPGDGFPSWIAEVMVRKGTPQEAVEFVQAVHDDMVASVNIAPAAAQRREE